MRIFHKLLLSFLTVGIGATVVISFLFYRDSKEALLNRAFEQLSSVKTLKSKKIEDILRGSVEEAKVWRLAVHEARKTRAQTDSTIFLFDPGLTPLDSIDKDPILLSAAKETVFLLLREGRLSNPKSIQALNQEPLALIAISDVRLHPSTGEPLIFAVCSFDSGFAAKSVSFSRLESVLLERSGLGESGESYLVGPDFKMRSQSRFFSESTVMKTEVSTAAVQSAFAHGDGYMITNDYREVQVMSSFTAINVPFGPKWILLSEIDVSEVMIPFEQSSKKILLTGFMVVVIVTLGSFFIARHLSLPLLQLSRLTDNLAQGILEFELHPITQRKDEIGDSARSLARLLQALRQTRDFAVEVGKGNFDTPFHPLGLKDETGIALEKMKRELKRLAEIAEHERLMKTAALLEGEESERKRVSRELHDGLGQILTAIQFQIQSLPESEKRQELLHLLYDAIEEVKLLSYNLMPRVLVDFGLRAALQKLSLETAKHTAIPIRFESNVPTDKRFSEPLEIGLFRIAQEAINNAVKHANTGSLSVKFLLNDNRLSLSISDKGKGIGEGIFSAENRKGNGLRNMEERAKILGAAFSIHSTPEQGTEVRLSVSEISI
ncbi:MAG: histidine kinase [Chloroherpetonaceae bacterium]|nr:histidine kinase [Chloroherpetonaceae bacterium]